MLYWRFLCFCFLVNSDIVLASDAEIGIPSLKENIVTAPQATASQASNKKIIESDAELETDPAREENLFDIYGDDGNGAMVQGLPQVRTEVDGHDSIGADNGRALSWEDVPQEIMAGVAVYKSPTAKLIEGALGGTVNIKTQMPFQLKPGTTRFSLKSEYSDLSETSVPSGSVLYADQLATNYGRIAYLVNFSSSESDSLSNRLQVAPFIRREDLAERPDISEDAVYVPYGISWREALYAHKRRGMYLASQWEANNKLEVFAKIHASRYLMNWDEQGAGISEDQYSIFPREGTEFTYYDNNVFTSGQLASNNWRGDLEGQGVRVNGERQLATRNAQTTDFKIGFEYLWSERLSLKSDYQYIGSTTDTLNMTVYTSTYVEDLQIDTGGKAPHVLVGEGEDLSDPSRYFWNAAMDKKDKNKAHQHALTLDSLLTIEGHDWFNSLWVGGRFMSRSYDNLDAGYNWGSISDHWNSPLKFVNEYYPELTEVRQFAGFVRGDGRPTNFLLPSTEFVADYALVSDLVRNEIKSGLPVDGSDDERGWIPSEYGQTDVSEIKRSSLAAYFMLGIDNKDYFRWPVDGNLGVRFVQISTEVSGHGEFKLVESDTLDEESLSFGDGSFFRVSHAQDKLYALPSLNLRFKLNSTLDWRIALAKTIANPELGDLKPFTSINADLETLSDGTNVLDYWYGQGGNPSLKPLGARQFDTSLEWSFSNSGSAYATYFYKGLSNLIVKELVDEEFENNGLARTVEVERPQNANSGHLTGVEFGYQQSYDFLPGLLHYLSAEASVTYMDSAADTEIAKELAPLIDVPLERISELQYKFVVKFQKDRLSLRSAYKWRDDYLLSTTDVNTGRMTWHDHYAQLDLSLAYRINDNYRVQLSARNLIDNIRTEKMGPFKYANGDFDPNIYSRKWRESDRNYSLIFSGRF